MTSIQSIRTFESLLGYLGDVLQWPVSSDEIEDMTYEYRPAELGITGEAAVNITNIVRIRPFHSKQPWSVFYIEFASGNLPVVVLRRVLNNLIVRQRATKSDHQRWNMHDLLFISSHGAATDRHVTFAHFAEAPDGTQLPTLRVLGWDGDDSKLRMQDVEQRLQKYFMFPADAAGVAAWPQTWNAAFTLRPHETIKTTKQLSVALARLARDIRDRLKTVMSYETESGQYAKLMASFKSALIHDLVSDDFADMYAQTIAYGLLSTRIANPTQKSTQDFAANLQTNPFLRELMQTFLTMGGRDSRMHVDFDELGINEIIELLNAAQMDEVLLDFNNRNAQEDPVIHFYELFLKEYDAKKRMARGVFYTPKPVVGYIVRSVHELLQRDFGLADGLADTTTWAEMLASGRVERLPLRDVLSGDGRELIDPNTPFVQILDPATGTGTFLVEVIDVIHRTMLAKWSAKRPAEQKTLWNDYVELHLLPRVFGYELMMAPYAIAHLKIGLKLAETGYTFNGTQRANVYLTNALEPGQAQLALTGIIPALAHEATAVNTVKRDTRFTVVVGNPPYSGHSTNNGDWIRNLTQTYYLFRGQRLNERNSKWLQDDYVKFIRIAEHEIANSNAGILGFITNHGYLDNPTFRGMRETLYSTFQRINLLDLNGNSIKIPSGVSGQLDQNVFEIRQGVSIMLAEKNSSMNEKRVAFMSLSGTQLSKYSYLGRHSAITEDYKDITVDRDFILFISQDIQMKQEYFDFVALSDCLEINVLGVQTHRDDIAVAFSNEALTEQVKVYRKNSQSMLVDENIQVTYLYRLFDKRFVNLSADICDRPRKELVKNVVNKNNLCLGVGRQGNAVQDPQWSLVFISKTTVDANIFRRGGINIFPLHSYDTDGRRTSCNLSEQFTLKIFEKIDSFDRFSHEKYAETILTYVYTILHAPSFRNRYSEFLKIDFPRIPIPGGPEIFHALVPLGEQLVALHLMESPLLDTPITRTVGSNWTVSKVGFADGTVWIDGKGTKTAYLRGTTGFAGVPEEVWNFHIGGYQVCEKWLKDRKGRVLSAEDIAHYQKIVVALQQTIRLMAEIDVVIDAHGGWPGAFASGVETSSEPVKAQFGQTTSSGTPKRRAAEESLPLNFADDE